MSGKLVAYYRVSTTMQGVSGLGLEAQVACVERYAREKGCTILRSFQEVESGKRSDRPELTKAISYARRSKAVLCIAKLDRLARNVHFLSGLMRSGVEFVACDHPNVNKLTAHILASVAEDEAERISERTKAALAALKARGVPLGASRPESRNLSAEDRARGTQAAAVSHARRADAAYADLIPVVVELQAEGKSHRQIAQWLNDEGYVTRQGKSWSGVQVGRVLARAEGRS